MLSKVESEGHSEGEPLYPDYLRKSSFTLPGAASGTDGCQTAFYDPLEKVDEVGPFEHDDPGHRADPSMPNLFKHATKISELSPHCGVELQGVQLVRVSTLIKEP